MNGSAMSIAHAIWISQYSTGVANRMIKMLNDSDAELTARLLVAMDTLDANSFTVPGWNRCWQCAGYQPHCCTGMFSRLILELNTLAQHEAGYQLSLFHFYSRNS
jgi:hypothetical protein